jgi:ribonucleases P/MRP protein subunit RPP40
VVASQDDVRNLQGDLKNLCKWSRDWLMLFNVEKCKVMLIRYKNKRENYEMDGKDLDEVDEDKDLDVIMQNDLKWNRQFTKGMKTAPRVLVMIWQFFSYLREDMALHLCKTLVRPHLECCMQAWRPYLKKDRANGRGSKESNKTGALYEKISL